MSRILLAIISSTLIGCSTATGVVNGESAGSQAVVVGKITVLGSSAASMLSFAAHPLMGPRGAFTTESQDTLIIESLIPATYNWTEGRMVAMTRHLDLTNTLPSFIAKSGCINYFGDITIDLRGAVPRVSVVKHKEDTLAQLKAKHPQLFIKNSLCQ